MHQISLQHFKEVLLESKREKLIKSKAVTNKVAQQWYDAQIGLIDELFVWVHHVSKLNDEGRAMSDLKITLDKLVSIADLSPRNTTNELEEVILKEVESIPAGQGKPINLKNISAMRVSMKVTQMRREKKLPLNVYTVTHQGVLHLVKDVKDRPISQRKKRSSFSNQ